MSKWHEAQDFLSQICNAVARGKVDILIPEGMPETGVTNFYITLAIAPHIDSDFLLLAGPHGETINAIKLVMKAWMNKNIAPGAKITIKLPHKKEIKKEYVDEDIYRNIISTVS